MAPFHVALVAVLVFLALATSSVGVAPVLNAADASQLAQLQEFAGPVLTELRSSVRAHNRVSMGSMSRLRARGPVDVDCKNMKKCFIDEDPLEVVKGEAISVDDTKRFAKDTENRVRNILTILDELNPNGMDPREQKLQDEIKENQRLLKLSDEVKDKAMLLLMRRGVELKLPSESSTYVDAAGRHWGDAGSKLDLDYLKNQQHKWIKRKMDEAEQREARMDVKQFHNSMALTAREVDKLEDRSRICPCTCPVVTCPCKCTANIATGEVNNPVEAEEFPDPDRLCVTSMSC